LAALSSLDSPKDNPVYMVISLLLNDDDLHLLLRLRLRATDVVTKMLKGLKMAKEAKISGYLMAARKFS
jgi:hypothetical protein